MRIFVLLVLASCLSFAQAQTPAPNAPQPESQLSPQAAYDQAIRPFEITRRSSQNWSEIETNSLKLARANAKAACAGRDPDQVTGADLLALAHLCAFAQMPQPVYKAASKYIDAAQATAPSDDPSAPTNLSAAFDYKVQASLNLERLDDAFVTAQTMLRTVPYNEFTSEATGSTARNLHFQHTDQALMLLAQRQPAVLALIKASAAPAAAPNSVPAVAVAHPALPLHTLYADALALPAMWQFSNQLHQADLSYAELEAALPATLPAEDGLYIAEMRRQYLLLGAHLPTLTAFGSLIAPDAPAPEDLNTRFTAATVFLLFPDWCNQCGAMVFGSLGTIHNLLENYHTRFYALMAQDHAPEKAAKPALKNVPLPPVKPGSSTAPPHLHVDQQLAVKSTPDAVLAGTPTLMVPNETLAAFAASDFPLVVVIDHNGIIRAMQLAPEDALAPGGDVEQIVRHVVDSWPPD